MSSALSGPLLGAIPSSLKQELTDQFDEIVKNFRLQRWEASELKAGKFCEVVYSILEGHASGTYPKKASKPKDMVAACKALEGSMGVAAPRGLRIQIPRMLVALYEIRNNRNVGHVGGDVDPDHMDAVCVMAMCRWIMAELVRVFHNVSTDDASKIVDSLTEREILSVWEINGQLRVLDTSLGTVDKMMLLSYKQAGPVKVSELVSWIEYGNASRFRTQILKKAHDDRLLEFDRKADTIELSPTGVKYVEDKLSSAL